MLFRASTVMQKVKPTPTKSASLLEFLAAPFLFQLPANGTVNVPVWSPRLLALGWLYSDHCDHLGLNHQTKIISFLFLSPKTKAKQTTWNKDSVLSLRYMYIYIYIQNWFLKFKKIIQHLLQRINPNPLHKRRVTLPNLFSWQLFLTHFCAWFFVFLYF